MWYIAVQRAASGPESNGPSTDRLHILTPAHVGQILRSCAKCGTPFQPRHARHRHCPIHEPHGNESRSPTTRTRPSSSTQRERIRQQVLARDPHCQLHLDGCTGASEVADHIVPAEHGGTYTLDNLRGACHHCNSKRGGERPPSPGPSLQHGTDPTGEDLRSRGRRPPVPGPTRLA